MGIPIIAVIAGTRPEAIKLAPVISALRARAIADIRYIATGQHRDLFRQALSDGPVPDIDLRLMQARQSPARFLARAAAALRDTLAETHPALVLVHGDTATAYAGAIAAYRLGIPIGHVEAGLRTSSIASPFPEEMFRRAISRLALLHFAPTPRAGAALLREGVPQSAVHVTGNTGIDRLFDALGRAEPVLPPAAGEAPQAIGAGHFGLVTIHRGENRGTTLTRIGEGLIRVATELALPLIVPLHPSPGLRPLASLINAVPAIHVRPPMDHEALAGLLRRAALVLTDSGGLQEEAVTLGTPVVILRGETERVEAVEAGRALLAGSDPALICAHARVLLRQGRFPPSAMFGDGHAAGRIAQIIEEWLVPASLSR